MTSSPAHQPLRAAVFLSGSGRTLRNLLGKIQAGQLALDIRLVVSSNSAALGNEIARQAGIATEVMERRSFADDAEFSDAIFAAVRAAGAEWGVLAGFLKHLVIPLDFEQRVVNIHPALVPAFCGAGYYGHRVHQAALDYGVKVTGCTVHFVDNEYDHGPIILQRVVPVLAADTVDTLADRVFDAECEAFPAALQLLADGRVTVADRQVTIAPAAVGN